MALATLVFAPAAFAQDDNPSGDDLRGDDRGEVRDFDDNPTGDDAVASPTPTATGTPTASATAAAAAQYKKTATALPDTGGSVPTTVLAIGAGALLVAGGLLARRFMG